MSNTTDVVRERRFAFLAPATDWTQRAFDEYWLHDHGRLVVTTPGYGHYRDEYVQDHLSGGLPVGAMLPFAGMASVLIPRNCENNFSTTTSFRQRILPDEQIFLDRHSSPTVRAHQRRITRGRGPVKIVLIAGVTDWPPMDEDATIAAHSKWIDRARPPRGLTLSIPTSPPTDMDGLPLRHTHAIAWIEEAWFDTEGEMLDHLADRTADAAPKLLWSFRSNEHVLHTNAPGEQEL